MLINFDWILIICQRHSLIFEFTWIIFYILIVTLWCRVPFHRCGNWGLGRFGTLTKITQVVSSVTEIQDNVVYIAACSLSVLHLTLVCCSVAKSCPTVCDPMGYSTSGFPVPHHLLEFAQVHVHCIMMPSSHVFLFHPLLLLPSVFPSIRIFSNESSLCIRWPKYWSFSFSISPSNEYSGLISFRIDWLYLLAVQGTLKSLLQHHSSKASILRRSTFFIVQLSHPYMTTSKTIALTRWN